MEVLGGVDSTWDEPTLLHCTLHTAEAREFQSYSFSAVLIQHYSTIHCSAMAEIYKLHIAKYTAVL